MRPYSPLKDHFRFKASPEHVYKSAEEWMCPNSLLAKYYVWSIF